MTGKALAGCREIPGVTVCQQVLAEKQSVVFQDASLAVVFAGREAPHIFPVSMLTNFGILDI